MHIHAYYFYILLRFRFVRWDNNKIMETHEVLDLVYTPEEGQECFSGTHQECVDFINEQGGAAFMYKIAPIVSKANEA